MPSRMSCRAFALQAACVLLFVSAVYALPRDSGTVSAQIRQDSGAPRPEPGGDSYGGKGKTFEPMIGSAKSTVVLLHGLSGTVTTVVPIVPLVQFSGLTRTRFILPQADTSYVSYRGRTEPSWFNQGGLFLGAQEYPDDIRASANRIQRIIDGEKARGVEKIAVVGLSQGGALAASVFLRSNTQLAGVVGLSAWIPESIANDGASAASGGVPLFMIHGENDDAVSLEWSSATIELVRRLGRTVRQEVLPGVGHAFGSKMISVMRMTVSYLKEQGL